MTKIEWADETWNPITGCDPISEGCKNCYAQRMSKRLAGRHGYPKDKPFAVALHPDKLFYQPWMKSKKSKRIFACSMGDLFHKDVTNKSISDVLDIVEKWPQHTFMILTKRAKRMQELFELWEMEAYTYTFPLPNLWPGVTIENQQATDERIPLLLQTPAAVRFISVEPMLGEIDLHLYLHGWKNTGTGFIKSPRTLYSRSMVICGAETGPGKRPMNLDWARSLRDQCQEAGVPFFFKKDSQGNHTLDGEVWEQFPNNQKEN